MLSQQIGHFFHLALFSGGGLLASSECMYRIKHEVQKMCPHLAILGAVGSLRHIGHEAACVVEDAMI